MWQITDTKFEENVTFSAQEASRSVPDPTTKAVIYMDANKSRPKILFNKRQLGSEELCNLLLNSSSCARNRLGQNRNMMCWRWE